MLSPSFACRLEHEKKRFCLPEGLWADFSSDHTGGLTAEAGWLISPGECRTATRSFERDRLATVKFLEACKE